MTFPESVLQQIKLVCPRHCFGAVTDAQLAVGVRDVALDGGQADEEPVGDLLIPHAGRDQAQDFDFLRCERLGQLHRRGSSRGGGELLRIATTVAAPTGADKKESQGQALGTPPCLAITSTVKTCGQFPVR